LDPFVGSGTTALAAAQLGRFYIGIDIGEAYVEEAQQRVSNVAVKMPVFAEKRTKYKVVRANGKSKAKK
jgi:DNA modification methylase